MTSTGGTGPTQFEVRRARWNDLRNGDKSGYARNGSECAALRKGWKSEIMSMHFVSVGDNCERDLPTYPSLGLTGDVAEGGYMQGLREKQQH